MVGIKKNWAMESMPKNPPPSPMQQRRACAWEKNLPPASLPLNGHAPPKFQNNPAGPPTQLLMGSISVSAPNHGLTPGASSRSPTQEGKRTRVDARDERRRGLQWPGNKIAVKCLSLLLGGGFRPNASRRRLPRRAGAVDFDADDLAGRTSPDPFPARAALRGRH